MSWCLRGYFFQFIRVRVYLHPAGKLQDYPSPLLVRRTTVLPFLDTSVLPGLVNYDINTTTIMIPENGGVEEERVMVEKCDT